MDTCRICFDTEGGLCSPCKCDGSVKYVHTKCLLKWLRTRPNNTDSCELCKEPYSVDYDRPLERDLLATNVRTYLLTGPTWHIASTCASTILLNRSVHGFTNEFIYLLSYLTYQYLYILLSAVYIRYSIHQLDLYRAQWYVSYGPLLTCIHFILVGMTISLFVEQHYQSFTLVSIFNQCYLCLYPILHLHIVNRMNEGRRLIIINRRLD